MIILFALTYCLGQTVNRTVYLIEGELYKQSLPELFSDTTDKQYSFVDQSRGFKIDESNLKQLQLVGRYAINPSSIISQKQYKNLNDYQGNRQQGILYEYEAGKYQICYNYDIYHLDMDYCIQLNDTQKGYDFIFINYNMIAVSSISNNQFVITTYQGKRQKTYYTFSPTVFDQNVKSTKIDQMINNGDKYLLVVGTYSTQINVPIDVLKLDNDSSIIKTSNLNIKNIETAQVSNVLDVKGSDNGTVFVQVSNITDKITYQVQILNNNWKLLQKVYYKNTIGFDLGFSNLQGSSFKSFISVQETNYRLQQFNNVNYIEKSYSQQISNTATIRFTQNYLIILQNNKLIINNFQNNIQKINDLQIQILSIDVDFLNDKLIVFTPTDIRKYQLQDIYLTYQNTKTDTLDTVIINNGEQTATIQFRVLDKKDQNLYQISTIPNFYFNEIYSYRPFIIPLSVSGFNPELKIITNQQLSAVSAKYKIWAVQQDPEVPLYSQIIMSNGYTSIFKQFKNYSFEVFPCYQYGNLQCTENKLIFNDKYKEKVKLITLQQGTDLGYLVLVNNILDVYSRASSGYVKTYLASTIQESQIILDVVVADNIFVVYSEYIKVYTYPNGVEISKLDYKYTGINDPIKVWTNPKFNNYLFILSKAGQLVIGQFTNQFYITQSFSLNTVDADIAIIAKDKVVISLKINNIYDISLYEIINGQIDYSYELDLHIYSITDHILLKDYPNGKVGVYAQLNNQKALLIYGNTKLQRDQLQQVINLDKDIKSLSILSNYDETHILQSYSSKSTQTMIFVNYGYQYMQVEAEEEYLTDQFSQLLPVTYQYSNGINQVSIQKQIAYEYNFYNIVGQEIDDIIYTTENNIVKDLPSNLFSGQVNSLMTSSSSNVKFETRIKNYQQIKTFGYNIKCVQVPKFERIICTNYIQITYHLYSGKIIQKLDQYPSASKLILNKDNLSGLLVSPNEVGFLTITQDQLTLNPDIIKIDQRFDDILFYKNWIVKHEDNQLQYYYVKAEQGLSIVKQNQVEILYLSKYDYHPDSQSIYFTQYNNGKLSQLESSLDGDSLVLGQISQFDIEEYLNNNKIYVINLRLEYLQVIDNTLMISSTYGHLYTFNLADLKLINLYLLVGPSTSVSDIKIQDQYVIVKGQYLNLYKNTGDWSINKPYLSLESISIYQSDCIALYKQNGIVNILYSDKSSYVINSIIDDRIFVSISNLQKNPPSTLFIAALNGYTQESIYFDTVKAAPQGYDLKSILIYAFLGTLVMIGIIKS